MARRFAWAMPLRCSLASSTARKAAASMAARRISAGGMPRLATSPMLHGVSPRRASAAVQSRERISAAKASRCRFMAIQARSVEMRSIILASGTDASIDGAEQFLEQSGELAAFGLAQFLIFTGQPCDLDHAALAGIRQMPVERVLAAAEGGKIAVHGAQLGADHVLDAVGPIEEAQATVAGIRPTLVE